MLHVVKCPRCAAPRLVDPARRTAACFACGKRIDLAATPVAAVADDDARAREALAAVSEGRAPRAEPVRVAVHDPRLREAVDLARRARGERNRLKALVDALLARPEGFTLDELTEAAAVLGIPEAAAHAYVERRADAYRPRPGEYRGVR